MSFWGVLWRGAVVGGLALVAQVAFALPAVLAGESIRTRPMLELFATFIGIPVSGLLLAGLAARLLGLAKPVALAGLLLTVALAALSVGLGVPHLPTSADPGVLAFGAAFALLGYPAAALAVSPRETAGLPSRGIVIGLAVAVATVGSLSWVEITRGSRAAALADTGVPMVLADIPGHRLETVELTGEDPPLIQIYAQADGRGTLITVSVRRVEQAPRTCADADVFFHGDPNVHICQEIDGRWLLRQPGDQFGFVVAVHDGAVVTISGKVAALAKTIRLHTGSASELAAAPPGRR